MKKIILFLLLLLWLTLPHPIQAQEPPSEQLIRLQNVTFDPLAGGGPGLEAQSTEAGPYYLVQFNGPPQAVWLQQVEQLGATLLGYIPDNAYLARIEPEDVAKVKSLDAVRWVGPYRPAYKLAPALAGGPSAAAAEVVEVTVGAFPGEAMAGLSSFLSSLGGVISDGADTELGVILRVNIPAGALPAIAQNPAVHWIEPYITPQVANSEGRKVMNVESVWESHGLFGSGQTVAVSDSGLSVQNALSPDFTGRLVRAFAPSELAPLIPQCAAKTDWTDLNGHGTHVAGSILGNGSRSGSNAAAHQYTSSHAGNAPEAGLVFMALNTDGSTGLQCVSATGEFISKGYEQGARISSNSWGSNDNGAYAATSQIVDNYIWNHKDYLVLYAAGNSGRNGPGTVGSPGTAKNVLTIGATENNRPALGQPNADNPDQIADFSSRGPTQDGRLKPDVVAPGTWILSVRAAQAPDSSFWDNFNSDYAFMGGTSMATPLTAGASALVREWVGQARGLTNPSAALLKALLIHGSLPLPGATIPNTNSGWGRVDLKNTVGAQYTIFDDHVQGLTTGQSVTYTVQVVAATSLGTFFAGDSPGFNLNGLAANSADSLTLSADSPAGKTTQAMTSTTTLRVEPVPGFDQALDMRPIPSGSAAAKTGLLPLSNPVPSVSLPAGLPGNTLTSFAPLDSSDVTSHNFLQGMVGGGDFEDPAWTSDWQYVWLGGGVPVRTSNPAYVINGNYSMWLGGTPVNDSIWYPVSFPDTIDSGIPSSLQFNVGIIDQDLGFDTFCVAITDTTGAIIALGTVSDCVGIDDLYNYLHNFTVGEKNTLEGQVGYLVLYTSGDGLTPHMSAFVDDIVLAVDFPPVTLTSTPTAGPAGTTFLLTGQYNVPYGGVDICSGPCPTGKLGTVYADARGEVAAYLSTSTSAMPGPYNIQSRDIYGYGRIANTTLTILGDSSPSLTVSPTSGPAGTQFALSGSNFLPNDANIQVSVNNNPLGEIGSNSSGAVTFTIQTSSNTPAGAYQVQVTDSAGRTATTSFDVTAVPAGDPTMTVSPTEGPAGSSFVFTGSNFSANSTVALSLDGQSIGQTTANAAGGFQVTLNTDPTTPPGTYTLQATQGNNQASAQFEIKADDGTQTGSGLHLTLVWSDPPAQLSAASTLVNDLNLRVVGPGGTTYHGNGGSSPDSKNNVETIRLENPPAGSYTIHVEAQRVNATQGAQPYALIGTTAQNFGTNTGSVNLGGKLYLPLILK